MVVSYGAGDTGSPRKPFRAKPVNPQNRKPLRAKDGKFSGSESGNTGKINIPLPARYINGSNSRLNGSFFLKAHQTSEGSFVTQEVLPFTPYKNINDMSNFPTEYTEAYIAYKRAKKDGIPEVIRCFSEDMKDSLREIIFSNIDVETGEENHISLHDYRYGGKPIDIGSGQRLAEEIVFIWENDLTEFPGWKINIAVLTFINLKGVPKETAVNIFVSPSGEMWVVDYTAQQYDERAPFPLIQPLSFWKAWVTKHKEDAGATPTGMDIYDF